MVFSGMTFVPDFMEIGYLVENGTYISLVILLLKEGQQCKNVSSVVLSIG
jgi:hypothetical protein